VDKKILIGTAVFSSRKNLQPQVEHFMVDQEEAI